MKVIIDGKKIANSIYSNIKKEIEPLEKKPILGVILVGENPTSLRYVNQKRRLASFVGMGFALKQLDKNITERKLIETIKEFNEDRNISGYIVQFPLPEHINSKKIVKYINPRKDVDGFNPENMGRLLIGDNPLFTPCTPLGIMEIIKYLNISLPGKTVTVIGRSNIVGKPVSALLINAGATVTICNSKTKNIGNFTKKSDIVICAAGSPKLLRLDMINSETIVIDVGFSIISTKIMGDADFKNINLAGVKITPVPGGVGPLTVASLLKNTLKAHKNN